MNSLWSWQNSYWKLSFIVDFSVRKSDFPRCVKLPGGSKKLRVWTVGGYGFLKGFMVIREIVNCKREIGFEQGQVGFVHMCDGKFDSLLS